MNQKGERIQDKDINTLHVIANETFEEFASKLQKEIESETGFKFDNDITSEMNIRDASQDAKVHLKKQVIKNQSFNKLWNKIKWKTRYRTSIDDTLIQKCVNAFKKEIENNGILNPRILSVTKRLKIENTGITGTHTEPPSFIKMTRNKITTSELFNLLDCCRNIKRSTVREILQRSRKINKFYDNPQSFTERFIETINNVIYEQSIKNIRYYKMENVEYEIQQIFNKDSFYANEDKVIWVKNSVYDEINCDSDIECEFAKEMDSSDIVKLFLKMPRDFKIQTPIGTYNPDWALLIEFEGKDELYFVVETKGSTDYSNMRPNEKNKIECTKRHFKSLMNDVTFEVTDKWEHFNGKAIRIT